MKLWHKESLFFLDPVISILGGSHVRPLSATLILCVKWFPVVGLLGGGGGGGWGGFIRHQCAETERPTSSEKQKTKRFSTKTKHSLLICAPGLLGLKGRSVTNDVLAAAGEQLHLPVPRVRVHCRPEETSMTSDQIRQHQQLR